MTHAHGNETVATFDSAGTLRPSFAYSLAAVCAGVIGLVAAVTVGSVPIALLVAAGTAACVVLAGLAI
jgi:hypothetical protein